MEDGALWSAWWVWLCVAIVLGLLEIFAPGFIFLGFAVGALSVSLVLLGFGSPFPLPVLILVFAILSLVAWLALRNVFSSRDGQVRTFERDIND